MRFLGLWIHDRVPDAVTIWLIRDRLAKADSVVLLFKLLDQQLSKDGIIVNAGKMVDASFMEIHIQRNSLRRMRRSRKGSSMKNGTRTIVARGIPMHAGPSTIEKSTSDTRTM